MNSMHVQMAVSTVEHLEELRRRARDSSILAFSFLSVHLFRLGKGAGFAHISIIFSEEIFYGFSCRLDGSMMIPFYAPRCVKGLFSCWPTCAKMGPVAWLGLRKMN
jgi:hypothetical protein